MRLTTLALAALFLALPGTSAAAVKSDVDRHAGVRLTLDGRVLTAKLLDGRAEDELFGKRIDAICSPDFGFSRRNLVIRKRLWPAGASRMRFVFGRDVSRRAVWCLLEHRARDVAIAWFVRPGPWRFVAKGSGPSGEWWRLAGRRSLFGSPCAMLRMDGWGARPCFDELAAGRTDLGAREFAPCGKDVFVFGVAARAWEAVRVLLADGTRIDAALYEPPRRSRVRERYFVAVLPETTDARAVEASKPGELLRRPLADWTSEPCPT